MKPNLQVFFYAAFSALLLSLGIPNEILTFGSPLLGLFALVPLYHAFSLTKTPAQAFTCGAVQFSITHLLSSFWLSKFQDFAILTLGLTTICYIVAGGIIGFALYVPFAFTRSGTQQLKERSGTAKFNSSERIIWFAAAWTLHEWGKSTGFLAYPWGTLIQTAWRWPLITQVVALTGTWGISFLFSLFNAVIAETLEQLPLKKKSASLSRIAAFCICLFALTTVYGIIEYTKTRTPKEYIDTVMVQQNGDSWTDGADKLIRTSQRLTESAVSQSEGKPDLIVWSETVLNYLLPDYWYWYERHPAAYPLQESIQDMGVPYIIGAPWVFDSEKAQYENAAVLINEQGEILKHHGKIHLVPFAESIPYSDKKWMQNLMELVAGFSSSWTSGKEYTIFDIPVKSGRTVKVSTPICFEDAFPDVCRQLYLAGSQVFINLTNDSWSETNSSEIQHFVIASYRAQEYRTTLIRSTNGGYSVVVDPAGRILADMPLFEEDSLRVMVPVYEHAFTPYAILGDWLPAACVLIILYLLVQLVCSSKNGNQKNLKKNSDY